MQAYASLRSGEDEEEAEEEEEENRWKTRRKSDLAKMWRLRCNWAYTMIVTALVCVGYTTPFSTLHQFITYSHENGTVTEQPGLGESELVYAWVIAMYSVGETIAAMGTGILLRYFSYWSCFLFSVSLHLVGGVLYGAAVNGTMMMVSRLLTGAHAGLGWSLAVAYYGERCEDYDQLRVELAEGEGSGPHGGKDMEADGGRNVEGDGGGNLEGEGGGKVEGEGGGKVEEGGGKVEGEGGSKVEGEGGSKVEGEGGGKVKGEGGGKVEGEGGGKVEEEGGGKVEGEGGGKVEGEGGGKVEGEDGGKVEEEDGKNLEREHGSKMEAVSNNRMEGEHHGGDAFKGKTVVEVYDETQHGVKHRTRTKDLLHSLFAISNSLVSGVGVVLVVLLQLIPGVDRFRMVGWLNVVLAIAVILLQFVMFRGEGYCRCKKMHRGGMSCPSCHLTDHKWWSNCQWPSRKTMFLFLLVLVFYSIDSGYNVIDTLSNPILTNQFAFTVEDSGYFFSIATFGFAIGALTLPLFHRLKIDNRHTWVLSMSFALAGTVVLSDWQSIGQDPCGGHAFNSSAVCENVTFPGDTCYWRQRSTVTGKLCIECPPGCASRERTLNFVQFCFAFILWVASVPVVRSVTFIITSDQVGKDSQGTVLGLCTAAGSLSRIVTPLWLNSLYVSTGQHTWVPMIPLLVNLAAVITGFLLLCRRVNCGYPCHQQPPDQTICPIGHQDLP